MTSLSLDGYHTKQAASELFGRHRRTITKDIQRALAANDTELLSLLRIHTIDGKIQEGTDLSPDSLQELTREAQNPTIYLHADFVKKVKQRRSNPSASVKKEPSPEVPLEKAQEPSKTTSTGSSLPDELPLPEDPAVRSIVLEHLHFNERKHKEENKQLMDRILQVVETNQELQGQTNTLFNQFQNVLTEGGGVGNVAASSEAKKPAPRPSTTSTSDKPPVAPAIIVEATDITPTKTQPSKKSSAPKRKKSTTGKKGINKKTVPKKKTANKKQSFWKRDVRDLFRR